MDDFRITVFTPTYNRAYVLKSLYDSLLRQTIKEGYEWLIIDDGSTDNTGILVDSWIKEGKIAIRYYKVSNGGKPRAINMAVTMALSSLLFIVDSDDYLTDDAIEFMLSGYEVIKDNPLFVGIGGLRSDKSGKLKKQPKFKNFVDITNLERSTYDLDFDCNEAYKVDILKKYPFAVWKGETFTPEEIVLNEMALDGLRLRWFNKVIVISEYLEDGMTKGSWTLMKNNPMGYAMLFNHKLKFLKGIRTRINAVIQMIAHVILGGNLDYLFQSNAKLLTILCLPAGLLLACRRHIQYKKQLLA